MTILSFAVRSGSTIWGPEELRELTRLMRCLARKGGQGWDVGQTERGDPQFYILGPAPEQPCIACVSRLGATYVLEDGSSRVVGEDRSLAALIDTATKSMGKPARVPLAMRALLALCAIRATFEEKLAFFEEASEILARFSPQLSALV